MRMDRVPGSAGHAARAHQSIGDSEGGGLLRRPQGDLLRHPRLRPPSLYRGSGSTDARGNLPDQRAGRSIISVGRKAGAMGAESFETFFLASAGAGGAFVGLLIVAFAIGPRRTFGAAATAGGWDRAALALSAPLSPRKGAER